MRALLRPVAPLLCLAGAIPLFDLALDSAGLSAGMLIDNEVWRFQVAGMVATRVPTLACALVVIGVGAWAADWRRVGRMVIGGGLVLMVAALAAAIVLAGSDVPMPLQASQTPLSLGHVRLRGLLTAGAALVLLPAAVWVARPSRWEAAAA